MYILITSWFFFLIIKHLFFWRGSYYQNTGTNNIEFHAHRGYKCGCPENTLEAYKFAVLNNFEWVELDVVSTKDNVIICSHNHDLECETNGTGYINKLTYNQVKSLYTGIYDDKNSMHPIPKLKDVIEEVGDQIGLNIEIKFFNIFDLKTARALGKLLTSYNKKKIILSSFNPLIIAYFKIFYRTFKTGFLFQNLEYLWIIRLIHPDYIHPRADILNKNMVNVAKEHNIGINVWTADNFPVIKHLKTVDINGIISDLKDKHD